MRHVPFLKTLAKAKNAGGSQWRDVAAGYLVLRFFDRWMDEGSAALQFDPFLTTVKGYIRSTEALAAEARRMLLQFVDVLVTCEDANPAPAIGHLFEYGDYLKLNGQVHLAGHVYGVIVDVLTHTDTGEARLAAACIQSGITSRMLGKFEGAKLSFERAAFLAAKQNDFAQMVRARAGIANLLKVQGNLPAAERQLDELVDVVHAANEPLLEAKVRQLRAAVYHAREKYDDAMRDYYSAYEVLGGEDREEILCNLAAVEAQAGYRNAARDIHRLLAYTGQSLFVRSISLVNLIHIAVLDNDEQSFHRARLDFTAFDQRHPVQVEHTIYAQLYIAMGLERFGSISTAVAAYRRLAEEAGRAKVHQVEFEAVKRLANLSDERSRPASSGASRESGLEPPAHLRYITDTISATAAKVLVPHDLP